MVTGNSAYQWRFSNAGDTEGWFADDNGAVATVDALGGVLLFNSQGTGLDPNIQYWFPQPVDASRFSTIEVTLRSSNNYINDDVTFMWWSNFGGFDTRRSQTVTDFLFSFQTEMYDLTLVPVLPDEPWQGLIEAIRIDPVTHFEDQLGAPMDGWVEIESIAIY